MRSPLNVDVFADPGLPLRALKHVLDRTDSGRDEGDYVLGYRQTQIPLRDDGTLDLDAIRAWSRENDSDMLVVITEIPRRAGNLPKIAELHFTERIAIISLPALGWINVTDRLHRFLFDSLDALAKQEVPKIGAGRIRHGTVHDQPSETGPSVFIDSPWWRPRRAALVTGMVRTNEPLAAVPKLGGALAAAGATGAFGVFYSSIWEMANALPPWRTGLITVGAISVMVLWLLFTNRLWERRGKDGSLTEAAMYNVSTLSTLLLAVAVLYAALFAGILVAALVVIESEFMEQTIGTSVSLMNYVDIAWLSASMGTVAGALGSNFDSTADVRSLTHGSRYAQRFQAQDNEEQSEWAYGAATSPTSAAGESSGSAEK